MQISSKANKNYLAKLVILGVPIKHPNADRLQGFIIDGNRVWTDLTRHTGQLGVYFPLECKLNEGLLHRLSLYREPEKNADPQVKGYFEKQGRVKAIRLRGEPSEGIFLALEEIVQGLGVDHVSVLDADTEFDIWNGQVICEKYIPLIPQRSVQHKPKTRRPRVSRLVDNQFRLHEDTAQLKKNLHKLEPDDIISVTNKLHGTSFVVSKVLVKKPLIWWQKALMWLGVPIETLEYDTIYSSRGVIKNEYLTKVHNHFYGVDLWGDIKDALHEKAIKGITLYGEAVGYTSTGRPIQGSYDYGYVPPRSSDKYIHGAHYGAFIYRITLTNVDGQKIELSWAQIKEYCDKYGLQYVPEYFYGRAGSIAPVVSSAIDANAFRERLVEYLTSNYLEKDCGICINKVPAEGVVVRIDKLFDFEAYKLKSFRFLEKESKDLDKGEVDLETAESVSNEPAAI